MKLLFVLLLVLSIAVVVGVGGNSQKDAFPTQPAWLAKLVAHAPVGFIGNPKVVSVSRRPGRAFGRRVEIVKVTLDGVYECGGFMLSC